MAEIKKDVHNYNVRQMKEIAYSRENKRFHRRLIFEKIVVLGLSGRQEQRKPRNGVMRINYWV